MIFQFVVLVFLLSILFLVVFVCLYFCLVVFWCIYLYHVGFHREV